MVNLGLSDIGYSYVNLDDCWQAATRDEHGKLQPDSVRFPSGMKALGDYIHSKGLKFGIYSSAGFKTCQAFPASLGMEIIDAKTYADWGVDYLKYDNCYTDYGPPLKRYPPMAKALQSSGREILYSLCEWGRSNPSAWAGEIAQSWRVTLDIRDDWRSILTRAAIDTPLWRAAGPGGWNDPDMLEVGNGKCSYEEYKTHFSMWAMLKAPLIIGNDIREMSRGDEAYEILTNQDVIAVNQDPLGWQSRRIWSDRSPKSDSDIWSRGTNLIATRCASATSTEEESSRQQDNPVDQQWVYRPEDGTIKSIGTNKCLSENIWNSNEISEPLMDDNDLPLSSIDLHFGGRGSVKVIDCANATQWDIEAHAGGHIMSRVSKSCIGVDDNPLEVMTNGRRVSMSQCSMLPIDFHRMVDISEHQSWTRPQGNEGILLNLYQVTSPPLPSLAYSTSEAMLDCGPGCPCWPSSRNLENDAFNGRGRDHDAEQRESLS
jgi:hypothetical protein